MITRRPWSAVVGQIGARGQRIFRDVNEDVVASLASWWVLLDSSLFNDGLHAAVVATFTTDGVINMPSTTVGADSESGTKSFVVGATLSGASL